MSPAGPAAAETIGMQGERFLYHGFVKTVPKELDECAYMDGASFGRVFFR